MSPLGDNVRAAKAQLSEAFAGFRHQHRQGAAARQLCAQMADCRDQVLVRLFQAACAEIDPADRVASEIAVVAHGGHGRRDVAPSSDVDLMLLVPRGLDGARRLAERVFRDVFDAGLMLGHSLRTAEEAATLASQDAEVLTSLAESRLVLGNSELFGRFVGLFDAAVRRHRAALLAATELARQAERRKYGETVYLLEPNVKRSQGGLRDLQLLRWIGRIRYGVAEPKGLAERGLISGEDLESVERAWEYLLWLRNELHFAAEKAADVLTRAEQLRIAAEKGYTTAAGMLPVELFMRDYFRHTDQVRHVVTRFADQARTPRRITRLSASLLEHRVEGGFAAGPQGFRALALGRRRLAESLAAVMEMVDLANLYDLPIEAETWEVVRRVAATLPDGDSDKARCHFLSLLAHPARLGEMLRLLHETSLLERLIPALTHARGLLQFNQYHKYTVDEHCFRAVDEAAALRSDPGALGEAYRALGRKHLLHLALLIHDLGKGHVEDHCLVGRRIAQETCARLGLNGEETDVVTFLVANHLVMNHLAFRRDTSDENLLIQFAVQVGSPERLRMLFVMTAADLAAVGPGVWDSWKAEVTTDLFDRTIEHLAGERLADSLAERLHEKRQAVLAALAGEDGQHGWYRRQVAALPASYLQAVSSEKAAADLRALQALKPGGVEAQGQYHAETETVEFTVLTSEAAAAGIFYRLTGALSSKGLQILSAQISTLADGLVADRFWVTDPDYAQEPPPERFAEVLAALRQSLGEAGSRPPSFRRVWKLGGERPALPVALTRVQFDNRTSPQYTILDIFAADSPGLLYRIARTLFELGLSVSRAKIGTYLDQVVDVFYLSDPEGRKVEDPARLAEIEERLLAAVAEVRG